MRLEYYVARVCKLCRREYETTESEGLCEECMIRQTEFAMEEGII